MCWSGARSTPCAPSTAHKQVKFNLDYSGGYGSFGTGYWKSIAANNVCGPYTGPPLAWKVVACTTPNGQNWALQAWQRLLPNSGEKPKSALQSAWELQVSHWTGPLPVLWLKWDWIYNGRFDHLYGKFSYNGVAVHGFTHTSAGNPTDSYGRNVYVDTLDPPGVDDRPRPGRRLDAVQQLPHPPHPRATSAPASTPTCSGAAPRAPAAPTARPPWAPA